MTDIEMNLKKWLIDDGRALDTWKFNFSYQDTGAYRGSDWITISIDIRKPQFKKHGFHHEFSYNIAKQVATYNPEKYFEF